MLQLIKNQLYNGFINGRRQYFILAIFILSHPAILFFLFSSVVISNMIGVEEKCRTDGLYCSLPISRKQIVNARYISVMIVFILTLAITITAAIAANLTGLRHFNVMGALSGSLYYVFAPLAVLISFILPVHFKMGGELEKNFRYMIIVAAMVLLLAFVTVTIIFLLSIDWDKVPYLPFAVMLVAVLSMTTSYFLSLRFYRHRDI